MRPSARRWAAAPLAALCIVALPCLWDANTLATELRGLPDAFDLVIGRWHRHGEAYYQERIDRIGAQAQRSLADLDDLAVAWEHLGEHDRAIEVMAEKAALLATKPDSEHQYRYHANLGTFLAHAGRYDEALGELREAIRIEPNAHFGREQLQVELIEFVAAAKQDPNWWQRGFLAHAGYATDSHWQLLLTMSPDSSLEPRESKGPLEFRRGYDAIGGMLRFGGREGPELYRALGELFLGEEHLNLGWYALQRAIERGHPAADGLAKFQARIVEHQRDAVRHELGSTLTPPTLADYRAQREVADRWLAAFQRLEAEAIARGEDVRGDEALRLLLAAADAEVPRPALPSGASALEWWLLVALLIVLFVLLASRSLRKASEADDRAAKGSPPVH